MARHILLSSPGSVANPGAYANDEEVIVLCNLSGCTLIELLVGYRRPLLATLAKTVTVGIRDWPALVGTLFWAAVSC